MYFPRRTGWFDIFALRGSGRAREIAARSAAP
jgi:hypothetical protein